MIERGTSFLIGLVGAGIQASLTPVMHESEGERHHVRYLYRLIDLDELKLGVDDLPRILDAAQLTGFRGLNVTHPCKQAVIPLLDELSPNAAAIGAVNTVVFDRGRRIGHNTDCWGFEQNMRLNLPGVALRDVVLLGAGGAGAAVAHALMHLGVEHLHVHDLDVQRARSVQDAICRRFGSARASVVTDLESDVSKADGVVNATPTGMASFPGLPLPESLVRPPRWIADIVYFPVETELLALARKVGCRSVDGSGMAVHQAARAFQLFTGVGASSTDMQRDFEALVGQQSAQLAPAPSAGQ